VQARLTFVAGLLLCLAWLTPNHYPIWTSFYNEFFAALALLVLSAATLTKTNFIAIPPRWYLLLPILPLGQWMFGQVVFFGTAFIASVYLCAFLCAVVVAYNTPADEREGVAIWLARCLLIGALLSVLVAFLQWSGLYHGIWVADYSNKVGEAVRYSGRPFGNLAQPNNLSTLCALAAVSAVYLQQRTQLSKAIAAICVCVLMFGLVMTSSKTQYLQIGAFIGLWCLGTRRRLVQLSGYAIAVWCLAYVALTIVWPHLNEWMNWASNSLDARQASVGTRWDMWRQLATAVAQKPLLGWGWGQTSLAQYATVLHTQGNVEFTQHAHNLVLDVVLWCGVPIGLGIILAGVLWAYGVLRRCQSRQEWFALLVLAMIGMHAMVEFPQEYLYFLIPAGLAVGIVETRSVGTSRTVLLRRPILIGVWGVSVMLALLIWHDYRRIESDFRVARFNALGIGNGVLAERSKSLIFDQLEAIVSVTDMSVTPGLSEHQLAQLSRVTAQNPYAFLLSRHAVALAFTGQMQPARQELERLRVYWGDGTYAATQRSLTELAQDHYPQLFPLVAAMHDEPSAVSNGDASVELGR
jgi:O-antigen ligase